MIVKIRKKLLYSATLKLVPNKTNVKYWEFSKSTFLNIIFFDFLIFENQAMPHFLCIFVIFVDKHVKSVLLIFLWITKELQTPDSIGILRKNQEKKFRTSKSENLQGKLSWKNLGQIDVQFFSDFFNRIFLGTSFKVAEYCCTWYHI